MNERARNRLIGREERLKKMVDEKRYRTYESLVRELSRNLRLQKENPEKIVTTSFYFYDFWAEYADHADASGIFIGNIRKSLNKELDELLQIGDKNVFLKFEHTVYTFRPAGAAEYERLKSHPYYDEFAVVEEDDESWDSDGGKIISYAIDCGQDVEHAAEVLAILFVDVLKINPFFFSGVEDSGIPAFVTVVADVEAKDELSWEESANVVSNLIDYNPLFDYFRKL